MTDEEVKQLRILFKLRVAELHAEWTNAKLALESLPKLSRGRPKLSKSKTGSASSNASAARLALDLVQEYMHKQISKGTPRKNVPATFTDFAIKTACAVYPAAKSKRVRDLVARHRKYEEAKYTAHGYIHRVRAFD